MATLLLKNKKYNITSTIFSFSCLWTPTLSPSHTEENRIKQTCKTPSQFSRASKSFWLKMNRKWKCIKCSLCESPVFERGYNWRARFIVRAVPHFSQVQTVYFKCVFFFLCMCRKARRFATPTARWRCSPVPVWATESPGTLLTSPPGKTPTNSLTSSNW